MHFQLSVDTWLILVKSIGKLFSGFSDICVVLLMLVYALVNLEMVCLDMLIQIMLMIYTKGDHSQDMFLQLEVVL
jgi:muramoyltetrapeptide carboxypeptidase LdcA involved in peptidoglycan recycling